ncbi:MAG: DUF192 domain-containing protein [Sphingomonadales bacterium]
MGTVMSAAAKTMVMTEAGGTVPLTISSGKRQYAFKVEVARTAAEQSRGLMFRTRLGADRGMIFPMNPSRFASFWMKNTLIPLDMIFIRSDGTIANIAARAVPHSLEPVSSVEPVAAVLEIEGGRAAKLGLKPGDRVAWAAR